jgi:aspartate aminotransferase-like enzyme
VRTYEIPLVPGPTSVPEEVLEAYACDYGSADLEDEFFDLYAAVERQLQEIMGTSNQMAIMMGEEMLVLWGALKSVIKPGDRVVAVSTGPFGRGIGKMAGGQGVDVRLLRQRGMVMGSWEKLAGKVFRIGHMGSHADLDLVRRGMDVLEEPIGLSIQASVERGCDLD